MSLKKESNSFFSSVLVSCIYLSICFLCSTVLLILSAPFFQFMCFSLNYMHSSFFFPPVHAIRPKLGSDSCIPAVLLPLFISIWTVYLQFKVGAFHAVFSLALRLCEQLHLILYMKGVQIRRFGSIHS